MASESAAPATTFSVDEAKTYLELLRGHATEIETELVDVSHRIHEHPEVRFQENFASQLLTEKLQEHGFAVENGAGDLPTAFLGKYTNAEHTEGAPTIAIFCEYDALEGIGHGCGHNIIASSGLGAAIIVKRWLEANPDVPGNLLVVGSPGEEGGGGKVFLIEAGCLEGVDAAMMIHPGGNNNARRTGLARMLLEIEFTGKAAHAAGSPHLGVNALDAVNLTMVAIGLLRQQVRDDSRIHAIVADGGQAVNIIPEHAAIRAYARSPQSDYLNERLLPAVENCAKGAALATGTTVDIKYPLPAYQEMRSNDTLVALSEANLAALGRQCEYEDNTHSGSTDMGNVSHVVPSIHPHIELRPELTMHSRESAAAAASPEGDKAVIDGALELAMTAVELYAQPDLLKAVTVAFKEGR
ncbi:MAG: amidohydrolase [Streptosporangiales bacterium]|nr:amidohydrolase [Streptosporangiales bacterium]